ncbi:MAG TPA: nuclear transport factor 2 family protein [Gemmatimonadota bacterium]|nr:nuclear transport factor 2 family protein [Gemmatimonadota bacterium]
MTTGIPAVTAALAAAALTVLAHPVHAQPSPADETEVLAVVEALFDGMRAADSSAVRSTLHPEARLVSVADGEGGPALRAEAMDGFIAAVGSPHEETWDERIWEPEVRIDGRLATVWVPYAFYLGATFSHCGIDAFQLYRSEDGWQIFQIADTRRREGCEIPEDVSGR